MGVQELPFLYSHHGGDPLSLSTSFSLPIEHLDNPGFPIFIYNNLNIRKDIFRHRGLSIAKTDGVLGSARDPIIIFFLLFGQVYMSMASGLTHVGVLDLFATDPRPIFIVAVLNTLNAYVVRFVLFRSAYTHILIITRMS